ncbi:universal stress protein [Ascoidea rubescens DSM 1968]|uniref:Adenine nucleotide alpha hydrolases-like protein n=1 Tax=Ascoidea rubescens DSM 1968 TaxID=1344418 RepID=A0A1D2VFY9_9ASCO|nr:adenine nucleotide alpha hydrolases-like protein [Ascoidea rubescens DSM 1968]ODV60440.1 adenine nucleotide alpha hydrolases-like protein [Ascoidea rubescens DSM 1968]
MPSTYPYSLESALADEVENVLGGLDPSPSRGRLSNSISNQTYRSLSRGRTASVYDEVPKEYSASRGRKDTNLKWSILKHDPSERIIGANDGNSNSKKNISIEQSDEEQISDTDKEFEYNDGDAILPNYVSFFPNDYSNSNQVKTPSQSLFQTQAFSKLSNEDMLSNALSNNKPVVKTSLDKVKEAMNYGDNIATLEAIENARQTDSPIPKDLEEKFGSLNLSLPNEKTKNEKLKPYTLYKKSITDPMNSLIKDDDFQVPYTLDSDHKSDKHIIEALNENIKISEINSNLENSRCIRTITRGDFFNKISIYKKPKTFLLCMDFSPESKYALEWTIGTVLVDGGVLLILYVIEDNKFISPDNNINNINNTNTNDSSNSNNDNTNNNNTIGEEQLKEIKEQETARINGVRNLSEDALSLIKSTKLQVHIVVEAIHHPIPRHLVMEVIDHIQPTLVIVGSRGKQAIKGVTLGSLSNYLVNNSSVPIMVVRRKVKRVTKKKTTSNNIEHVQSLKLAKVD